jgi:hypothetical protein
MATTTDIGRDLTVDGAALHRRRGGIESPHDAGTRATTSNGRTATSEEERDMADGLGSGASSVGLVLEQQRECGAGRGGAFCVLDQRGLQWLGVNHRVAPVVKRDPLWQQLGAHAVRFAGDRVHAQATVHLISAGS